MLKKASRALALRFSGSGPATVDVESRSLEVTAATENPVQVIDWERFEMIDEVLLMSGCRLPESRQVPLLDTHSRYSATSVLGSARNLQVAGGQLVCRTYFAEVPEADGPWAKTRDGHITDFSIGYKIHAATWVPAGETTTIDGRSFTGPVRVVTDWTPKELSVCPIGADEAAKARAEEQPPAPNQPQARNSTPAEERKEHAMHMNKKLRAFLESRGLPTTATDQEAWEQFHQLDEDGLRAALDALGGARADQNTPAPGQSAANAPANDGARATNDPAPDHVALVQQALADERQRSAEIIAMGERFGQGELARQLVTDGKDLDAARASIMDALAKGSDDAATSPGFRPVQVGASEQERFRSAAQDALCLRSGINVENPAEGARDLMGYSLREMARESLLRHGQPTGGHIMDMAGRAMTTTDFPSLLANVANKALFDGYETAPETWGEWCGTGSVSDFKTHDLVSASETEDLDEVAEKQPYQYGKREDAKEQYKIVTYGKLFAITRQTIINDDLAALTDTPRAHGEAAARKVGDVAYAVLIANGKMRDGIELFHSDHGNLGTAGVVSETTIGEAIRLMKMQQDLLAKRRLNIRPQAFLAPVTIEGAAEVFFNSTQFTGTNKASTRTNPYAGNRFKRIYEPRLDDNSDTAYYLLGPAGKTVNVYFLNGQQAPYLETRNGWSVDGVEYKVRIDCGAKAVDWKAMVKNAGA